jgi:S-adenosylmethionine decarboxylase
MGTELLIDAIGCDAAALRSRTAIAALLAAIVGDLELHPLAGAWHTFPGPGAGITGLLLLSESHLTIHTFPERGSAALNLYCCRRRPAWDWETRLAEALGASTVRVREAARL